jgi:hypothetical protein
MKIACALALLLTLTPAIRQTTTPQIETKPMHHATGTFEVKMKPEPLSDTTAGTSLSRMSLDKVFRGGLEATSKGEMLSVLDKAKGSGGYVALEQVTGTLDGKSGGFALQHSGTMTRGVPQLTLSVIPDSGTGELTGISGSMTIQIADGKHSYDFAYSL